jgi:NAD(P)-dependent dehydrogenase (short-subunit alcohol dehydrogenase family)
MNADNERKPPSAEARATADKQREIQREQDRRDASAKPKAKGGQKQAVQAGAREHPAEMPAQHVDKPGRESELQLKPQFLAPDYEGSGKLRDCAAIVTGGDSGIGRAVAVLFAREGADVAIVYLESRGDAEETQRCVEAEGARCLLLEGDVKDQAFCDRAVERTLREFGRLDVLVNNAAFQEHAASLEELSDARFEETLHTNVLGYFHMAKAALPHLKRGAAIINTGSVTGFEGSSHLLDYSATKGAIHAFTKSLASNLLDKGIRVNAVAPGPVDTAMAKQVHTKEIRADYHDAIPLNRYGLEEELAEAIYFLCSASASYITGQILAVDGGFDAAGIGLPTLRGERRNG